MSVPFLDVQRTLYEVLSGALACPVADEHPPNAAFPYVTIGAFVAMPNDFLQETGADLAAQVDVWSRQRGNFECEQIMQQVIDLLHRRVYTLPTAQWASCSLQMAQVMRDADGVTRHGVMRFLVMVLNLPQQAAGRDMRTLDDDSRGLSAAVGGAQFKCLDD